MGGQPATVRFLRDYKQHEPAVIAFLAGQALADWAQQLQTLPANGNRHGSP